MAETEPIADLPSRECVQRRLDALIAANRFTIAVVFPLVGAITLVASAEGLLPEPLAFNPLLLLFGTLVMRSPLLVGVLPRVGWWALGCLGLLTVYTYVIELIGVRTDWPYGAFEYGVQLGPVLFGEVPLALALFFVPLVLNAYLLTLLSLGTHSESVVLRIPVAIALVVGIDVVLDPAAVALGFWAFSPPGAFYGVPISNYLGWALSGTVAVVLIDLAFDRAALLDRVHGCAFVLDDMVSFVFLWGTINLLYGNFLAVATAIAFGIGLLRTGRYDLEMVRTVRPSRSGRK